MSTDQTSNPQDREAGELESEDGSDGASTEAPEAAIDRPFGGENRLRLISEYLDLNPAEERWRSVYRLLLWTDRTTGLAHCYESDKSQPGRPWYERSLRFHKWLADALQSTPAEVGSEIDWLFQRVVEDYAKELVRRLDSQQARAQSQLAPYAGMNFPMPGTDPDIVDVIKDVLSARLTEAPTDEEWRTLSLRVREVVALENKRRNMVGEGFEDLLCTIVRRLDTHGQLDANARAALGSVPGFRDARQGGKPIKVDLAIYRKADRLRTMVTSKWSIRADRERQFTSDLDDYIGNNALNTPFSYVLVTNEFDPARLCRACEQISGNSKVFSSIVHIAPESIRAAYGPSPRTERMRTALSYIDSGRITSLDAWLQTLLI